MVKKRGSACSSQRLWSVNDDGDDGDEPGGQRPGSVMSGYTGGTHRVEL